MSKTVIKIEDVSKMYRLGEVGTGTLTHDLQRTWAKLTGKPDPFAKVGVSNDREQKGGDYAWALKDINLEIKEGEILGIIGRNGAGKSTLLKLLSRVTAPTTGRILTKGRIASLLEVGTGFHPELTGRENIYLNGAILGMTQREITQQLEEIVEFSGCTKYIDTPVKRYSSGMQVRLGFAVAAYLECEILIIDEVLAVGDAEFQKKCLNKIQSIRKNGKTIIFVSHNISMITQICTSAVWINNGKTQQQGNTNDITSSYLTKNRNKTPIWTPDRIEEFEIFSYNKISITDISGYPLPSIPSNQNFNIEITYTVNIEELVGRISILIKNKEDLTIITSTNTDNNTFINKRIPKGKHIEICQIPGNLLSPGTYYLTISKPIQDNNIILENICSFEISEDYSLKNRDGREGIILPLLSWVNVNENI